MYKKRLIVYSCYEYIGRVEKKRFQSEDREGDVAQPLIG